MAIRASSCISPEFPDALFGPMTDGRNSGGLGCLRHPYLRRFMFDSCRRTGPQTALRDWIEAGGSYGQRQEVRNARTASGLTIPLAVDMSPTVRAGSPSCRRTMRKQFLAPKLLARVRLDY